MYDHPCDPAYETAEPEPSEDDRLDPLEEREPETHDRF